LLAGAIDELHLALSPVVLGVGEALFAGIDLPGLGYQVTGSVPTEEERQRAVTLLGEARAEGIPSTHAIEVRPAAKPADEGASVADIRYPPEPA